MSLYFIDWVNIDNHGQPDEEGPYYCAFSDGTIEVMTWMPEDDWTKPIVNDVTVTHWAEVLPEHHPDYDPSTETQENEAIVLNWLCDALTICEDDVTYSTAQEDEKRESIEHLRWVIKYGFGKEALE